MHAARSPSAEMLHSVGALMDPGFLREAVADANEPAHAHRAAPSVWRRPLARARDLLVRLSGPARTR